MHAGAYARISGELSRGVKLSAKEMTNAVYNSSLESDVNGFLTNSASRF